MPGVFRPYTLTDILGTMQDQAVGNTDTSVSGVGAFAEDDEVMALADAVSGTVQVSPAWDAGYWSSFTWG